MAKQHQAEIMHVAILDSTDVAVFLDVSRKLVTRL